jgi:hypothetical protein
MEAAAPMLLLEATWPLMRRTMNRMSGDRLPLIVRLAVPALAVFAFACSAAIGREPPQQSRREFLAVLVDEASEKPVPAARIILAPKKEGKPECTIDTSLTGVSNERGEVRIPNVAPGEYAVFYNLSGSLNPGLKGKVVNYDPADKDGNVNAIARSLGPMVNFKGGFALAGDQLVMYGCIYAPEVDLIIIISKDGESLKVRVPSAGSVPVKVEICTKLPPQYAPKSGH